MRLFHQDDTAADGVVLEGLPAFAPGAHGPRAGDAAPGARGATPRSGGAIPPSVSDSFKRWKSVPLRRRLLYSALLGAVAASGVAYLTSQNSAAAPADAAVLVRVLIIGTLVSAGIYAQTSEIQTRMGSLLVVAGVFSSVWLLNGSSNRLAFSVGMLFAGLAPTLFCYLMLVHPTGQFRSRLERRWLIGVGGVLALVWFLSVLTSLQPPIRTPLVRCAPACPDNVFFLGFDADGLADILEPLIAVSWIGLTWGTAFVLYRRVRMASAPIRRSLSPVGVAAGAQAVLLSGFIIAEGVSSHLGGALGSAYIEVAVLIPLAILLGLGLERLFMGGALAAVVNKLASSRGADPQLIIGNALNDPSLTIAYPRPALGTYVDSRARPVAMPPPADRAVTWVGSDSHRVAAVIYSGELRDQERFLEAVGAAALLRLENTRLEAELRASTADLMASRIRLVESAHAERRRIERDLHDGVQQQLVVLRIKLESAAQMLEHDPNAGSKMVAGIGRQMDEALDGLRSLARGIYPSVLHEHGLVEALKSVGRQSPVPVSVRGSSIGRYREDVEVAVYFCCLEALQNIAKHAGPGANGTIILWQDRQRLWFEVRDSGGGFDCTADQSGSGMVNMHDRIDAVGGTLTVRSRPGAGTSVRGSVPCTQDEAVTRAVPRFP